MPESLVRPMTKDGVADPPVLRKNSRGDAFDAVIVVQATEPSPGDDAMRGWEAVPGQCRPAGRFVRQSWTQRGMWALTVVVWDPLRQDPPGRDVHDDEDVHMLEGGRHDHEEVAG
jgi:hypothetical protein